MGNFLRSKGAQAMFRRFGPGTVRAASTEERQAFYELISFEIEDKPVTVVERGPQVLLMYLSEGKLFWVELFTAPERKP